ncbi:MAG: SIMPL domain-containing protein [Acidobacteria bacterium]|nr:SIMPL domain-containing protein [Acidobacteriota bacterium]
MSRMILAALLAAAATTAAFAQEPTNVVITTGEAIVQRAPDRAFVTIASEARAKASREAQRQNADTMAAVRQRLTQAGIATDAVRTLGIDLQQEFDFPQGRRVPREYVARNTIEVRIDDLARVGDVLDAAVQAGATSSDTRDSPVIIPRPMVGVMARAEAAATPTPVEAGTIEIRARVTLTASMK